MGFLRFHDQCEMISCPVSSDQRIFRGLRPSARSHRNQGVARRWEFLAWYVFEAELRRNRVPVRLFDYLDITLKLRWRANEILYPNSFVIQDGSPRIIERLEFRRTVIDLDHCCILKM